MRIDIKKWSIYVVINKFHFYFPAWFVWNIRYMKPNEYRQDYRIYWLWFELIWENLI